MRTTGRRTQTTTTTTWTAKACRGVTARRDRARQSFALMLLAVVLAGCSSGAGASPAPEQATTASAPTTGSTSSTPWTGPTRLALITDFGNCDKGEAQVAEMVLAWEPEAIATAGDNTQGEKNCVPYTDSVEDYYSSYVKGPAGPRFWPTLGNHDYENATAGLDAFRNYFTYLSSAADPQQRWYDKRVGGIHLFMLDSDAPKADLAAQRTWLKAAVTRSRSEEPDAWIIAIFHRPVHTSGIHGQFQPMSEVSGWDYAGWGVDIVIAGHQHIYEDVLVDGMHHVTAGVGASGIARRCPSEVKRVEGSRLCIEGPGAMLLTATPASLKLEFHQPVDGADVVKDVIDLSR